MEPVWKQPVPFCTRLRAIKTITVPAFDFLPPEIDFIQTTELAAKP